MKKIKLEWLLAFLGHVVLLSIVLQVAWSDIITSSALTLFSSMSENHLRSVSTTISAMLDQDLFNLSILIQFFVALVLATAPFWINRFRQS